MISRITFLWLQAIFHDFGISRPASQPNKPFFERARPFACTRRILTSAPTDISLIVGNAFATSSEPTKTTARFHPC